MHNKGFCSLSFNLTCTFIGVWKPWSISTSKSCRALPVSHRLTSPTTNILKPNWPTNCFIVTIRDWFYFPQLPPAKRETPVMAPPNFRLPVAPQVRNRKTVLTRSHRRGSCWRRAMCFLCSCSAFSQPDSAANTTMQEFHFICQFLFQRDLKSASPGGNHDNQTWVVYLFQFLPAVSTHQFCLA